MDNYDGKPVVVTTAHRGVFFGFLKGKVAKEVLVIEEARNCLYFSKDVKGFLGLAETGPTEGCRVGPKAPEMTLYDITSVTLCTETAVKAWESAPWSE